MATKVSTLVLGAGELGMAVLEGLAQHPQRNTNIITVLLRPATISSNDASKREQISKIKGLGINVLAGDVTIDSPIKLTELFKPFNTVIGCMGMTGEKGLQMKIVTAVVAAGVLRYIPWQFGVDYDAIGRSSSQDLFSEQLDVRDLLRSQMSVSWVIVSTGMFMSFLFEKFFGVVDLDRMIVRALGSWENRVTVTTVEDIGRLTAEVVFAVPDLKNEVIFVAGDTVSYARVAEAVEQILGKKVECTNWDLNQLKDDLRQDPDDAMKKYRIVFAEGTGVSWVKETSFNWKRHIMTTDMEQWARMNLR